MNEINKYIYEQIVPSLAIESDEVGPALYQIPAYDESLDLIAPVERAVIEKVGPHYAAWVEHYIVATKTENGWPEQIAFITAPAEARAKACVSAYREWEREQV